jgi:hypothetical protein
MGKAGFYVSLIGVRKLLHFGLVASSLGALSVAACSSPTNTVMVAPGGSGAQSGAAAGSGSNNGSGNDAGGTGGAGASAGASAGSVAATGSSGSTSTTDSGTSSGSPGMDGGLQDAPPIIPYDAQVIVDGGANGMLAPGLGADTPSPPKPMVSPGTRDIVFSASKADPMAAQGQAGATQHGRLNGAAPLQWKLIVLLPGLGGGPGLGTSGWIASKGFHEFDVAYDTSIVPPHNGGEDPALVGNTRMNQFDAKGRMPSTGTILRPDCIEERVIKGLQYLAKQDPGGGWDWYLNPDGTMRWSDAGFFGYSYGATHAAIISVYVRLGLVVSGSGPWHEFHPEGTWLRTTSATPGDRAFAIYGKLDGRYPDYETNTRLLGWQGPYPYEIPVSTKGPLPTGTAMPYYMGSHSLLVDDQGHTEFCAQDYTECLYAFLGLGR